MISTGTGGGMTTEPVGCEARVTAIFADATDVAGALAGGAFAEVEEGVRVVVVDSTVPFPVASDDGCGSGGSEGGNVGGATVGARCGAAALGDDELAGTLEGEPEAPSAVTSSRRASGAVWQLTSRRCVGGGWGANAARFTACSLAAKSARC